MGRSSIYSTVAAETDHQIIQKVIVSWRSDGILSTRLGSTDISNLPFLTQWLVEQVSLFVAI